MKTISTLFSLIILLYSICLSSQQTQTSEQLIVNKAQHKAEEFLKALQVHYRNGDYQLHKNYSDSLLSVAKKHNFTKMHVLALINQGVYFNNRSEHHTSIDLYHVALEKCKLIPKDFRTKTIVLVNMGNTYHNIGSYKKAINVMEEVLKIATKTKNSEKIKAAALIGLANNYAELKQYNKVLDYAQQSKIIGKQTNNESNIATALNSISDAYYNQAKYNKAITSANEALALNYLKKPTKKRASTLLNIGASNYKLGHLNKALSYLNEAKKIAIDKGLVTIKMDCHKHISKIYEQKGDFKKSYIEQKKYVETRNLHLKNTNKATKIDLTKNIEAKTKELTNSNKIISDLSKRRKQAIIWVGVLFTILISLLFFYIKRKKGIEREQEKLQKQYTTLKNSITKTEKIDKEIVQEYKTIAYKNSSLTNKDRELYKKKIIRYMEQEKPYLNYNLNQSQLADSLEISSHHFSEVLHYCFEQNFYNFINSYRVLEAQKLIQSTKHKNSKILTIAFEAGFKSKTSFNRVFKNHTGSTPSEYRKKQGIL